MKPYCNRLVVGCRGKASIAAMEVTPESAHLLTAPTQSFLCPLSANIYKIDFVAFKIRALEDDHESLLFEIRKAPDEDDMRVDEPDDSTRFIRYHFGPEILDFKTIGTSLEFTVGDLPLQNFRIIERHYFRGSLIKSFDFSLPFVIPNSTNTWEVIYAMPELSPDLKQEIVASPWEMRSDSLYFVDGRLVMHNKAEYHYGV